jgi:hypothetical protein
LQKILVLTALLVMASVLGAGMLTGYLVNTRASEPNMAPVEEDLHLENCSAMTDRENINVAFTVTNTADKAIPINKLLVDGVSVKNMTGVTVYLNGTSTNQAASPLFVLENGDSLSVNLALSATSSLASSGELSRSDHIKVDVLSPNVDYYVETPLPLFYMDKPLS